MDSNNFSYSDELAEVLMDDRQMMAFLIKAIETEDPELVLQAVRTITVSRDHREIEIRNMGRDLPKG